MKNQKLKNALRSISKNSSNSIEELGIEKIQTIKGGKGKDKELGSGCTGTNCPSVNCGWN